MGRMEQPATAMSTEVPAYPRNFMEPTSLIETFTPAEGRIMERFDARQARGADKGDKVDNPRDAYDNRPSGIPWDETGMVMSLKLDLPRLVNSTDVDDPSWAKAGYYLFSAITLGFYWKKQRAVIPEGHFRVLKRGVHTEIAMPGYRHAQSVLAKWGQMMPIDPEGKLQRQIGNRMHLTVPANHIAVAYLTEAKENVGNTEDVVLFSQGSYVLNEDQYKGVHVGAIQPSQRLVTIGPVTILNIGQQDVGIAMHRNTNEYHVFNRGAPCIFDNKEWSNYEVVRRTTGAFKLGPLAFLTVSAGQVASVGSKDGRHLLLTEEGTYRLDSKDWDRATFDLQSYRDKSDRFRKSFKVGSYYVLTVEAEDIAVVKSIESSASADKALYHRLSPGRYHLYEKHFAKPEVVSVADLAKGPIVVGKWCFFTVQEMYLVGGRNQQTGAFTEWTEGNKLHVVDTKDYPLVERIARFKSQPQRFGPYTVVTISDGFKGVFEEDGELSIAEPGFHKVGHACRLREPLPNRPQEASIAELAFRSKDRFNLQVPIVASFTIVDFKAVAKEINSRGHQFSFAKLCAELSTRLSDEMERLLRERLYSELSPQTSEDDTKDNASDDDQSLKVVAAIAEMCTAQLNRYVTERALGIEFNSVRMTGAVELTDSHVRAFFSKKAEAAAAIKASMAEADAMKASESVATATAVEAASRDAQVAAERERGAAMVERTKREIMWEAEEQGRKLAAEAKKADVELRRMDMQIHKEEAEREAENAAIKIERVARAEFEAAKLKHEAAQLTPDHTKQMELIRSAVAAVQAYGESAWQHPDAVVRALEAVNQGVAGSTGGEIAKALLIKNTINQSMR